MEIYQLKSFLEVARLQNLTRAAESLHISQSALSTQIKLLEQELGVDLFSRSPRGMHITDQGRILLSYAEEVLVKASELINQAFSLSGKINGTFKLGVNTDAGFLKVGHLSRRARQELPEVDLIFLASETMCTPDMLRQNHIDVGFFFGTASDPDIISEQLTDVVVHIVIPKSLYGDRQSVSLQQLVELPWIWGDCGCPYYVAVQQELDKSDLKVNKVIDATDEIVVKELLVDGQGVGLLREDDAENLVAKGCCTIWPDKSFKVPLSVGCLKSRKDEPSIKLVGEMIRSVWAK